MNKYILQFYKKKTCVYCISFCKCVRAYRHTFSIAIYTYVHTRIHKNCFSPCRFLFFIAQKGRLSLILLSNTLNFYSTKLNHTISRGAKHFSSEIYLVKLKIFLSRRFTLFLFFLSCVNWLNFFSDYFQHTELFLVTMMARLTKWP